MRQVLLFFRYVPLPVQCALVCMPLTPSPLHYSPPGLNVLLFMRFSRSPPKKHFQLTCQKFLPQWSFDFGWVFGQNRGKGEGMFVCWFEASTVKCGKAITWKCIYYCCKLLLFLRVNCLCESCIKIASFPLSLFSPSSFFLAISLFAFYFVYFQRPCHKFLVILLQIIYAHIEL